MLFNTTAVTLAAAPVANLIGVSAQQTAPTADDGVAGDTTVLKAAGVPSKTTTVRVKGPPAIDVGDSGALVVTWPDATTFGSITSAICTAVTESGSKDGVLTHSITFQPKTA